MKKKNENEDTVYNKYCRFLFNTRTTQTLFSRLFRDVSENNFQRKTILNVYEVYKQRWSGSSSDKYSGGSDN